MNERLVEILIYIMSEMRRDRGASRNLDLLSKNLLDEGYSESEISSAFTWLLDKLDNEPEEILEKREAALNGSFRHLHEIERSIISVEAYGYLIQIKELDLINEIDVEQIIERALMLGLPRVGLQDIKSIVAAQLFTSENGFDGGFFLFDDNPMIH